MARRCSVCGQSRGGTSFRSFTYGRAAQTVFLSCLVRYNIIGMDKAVSLYETSRLRICKDHYVQTAFFLGQEIEQLLGQFPFSGISDTPKNVMQEFLNYLRMHSSLVDDTVPLEERDVVMLFNDSMEKYTKDVVREISYADGRQAQECHEVNSPSTSIGGQTSQSCAGKRRSVCMGQVSQPSVVVNARYLSSGIAASDCCTVAGDLSDVNDGNTSLSHVIEIIKEINPNLSSHELAFLRRRPYGKEYAGSSKKLHCVLCGAKRPRQRLIEKPSDPIQNKILFSCLVMNRLPAADAVSFFEKDYLKDAPVCEYHYAQAAFFLGDQTRRRPYDRFPMDGLEHLPYAILKNIVDRIRSYGIIAQKEDISVDDIIKFYRHCRSIYCPKGECDDETNSPNASNPPSSTNGSREDQIAASNDCMMEDEPLFSSHSEFELNQKRESAPPIKVKREVSPEAAVSANCNGTGNTSTTAGEQCADVKTEVSDRIDYRAPDHDMLLSSSSDSDEEDADWTVTDIKGGRSEELAADGLRKAMLKSDPNMRFKDLVRKLFTPPHPNRKLRYSKRVKEPSEDKAAQKSQKEKDKGTLEKRIRLEQHLCDRVEICSSLYLRNKRSEFLDRIVVYEEKWILYHHTYRRPSKTSDSEANMDWTEYTTRRRVMLTVWWSSSGVILHKVVSTSPTKNERLFATYIREMNEILRKERPSLNVGPAPIFLFDSSCGYIGNSLIHILCEWGFECIPYPSDSPDLLPHAQYVSHHFSGYLLNKKKIDDVNEEFCDFLKTKQSSFYEDGLRNLPERWLNCIKSRGSELFSFGCPRW